jgi:hypothetical protein
LKLFNHNQLASISTEKNLNDQSNSINDDWFQKLTAKSRVDTSSKVDLQSLSLDEKRKLIFEIWQIEKERGLRSMPKSLEEEDLQIMSKSVTSKTDIVSTLQ